MKMKYKERCAYLCGITFQKFSIAVGDKIERLTPDCSNLYNQVTSTFSCNEKLYLCYDMFCVYFQCVIIFLHLINFINICIFIHYKGYSKINISATFHNMYDILTEAHQLHKCVILGG